MDSSTRSDLISHLLGQRAKNLVRMDFDHDAKGARLWGGA
jgi:hypothetical protein